jgi:two-component system nitrogen regulation sensor histidine kinase GlnL
VAILTDTSELDKVLFESMQSGQQYTRRRATLSLINRQTLMADYSVTPINDTEQPKLILEIFAIDRYLRIDRDEATRSQEVLTRQMTRGLAHEIKNPLGGIRGSAQLLARELDDPNLAEFTNIIIEETDRLTRLVDGLLGPQTRANYTQCNVHEILARTARLLYAEFDGRIHLTRDYDPSIPDIACDKELVLQAVLNVARNAVQAMASTERPQLTFVTRAERQFTIGNTRHRLVVRINICDNGPGIASEVRQHLFFPMISGRPEGTGLGLSISQTIIHQHLGLIDFESEPGMTVFSIMLPLQPQ